MAEPRWQYFLWEADAVFASATNGEIFSTSKPVEFVDWQSMVVQFDVLDVSGGLAAGDFQCTLESTLSLGDFEAWQFFMWSDLPGSVGGILDFDSAAGGFELIGAWMRWRIKHNAAGSQWIRLRIKVFMKARASLDVARDRRVAQRDAQALLTWPPKSGDAADPTADASARETVRRVALALADQGLTVRALLDQAR